MTSIKLRYFFYGIVLSASLGSLATQATGTDGVFGDYFQSMINDAVTCWANKIVTGFDPTPGINYGKQECTTFDNLVNTVLKTFGSAPSGQAVVWYDPVTGNPIFGDVNWKRTGSDISYVAGKVGIGTALPSETLDVQGNARIGANLTAMGNVGIGTAAPATKLQVNGNIEAAWSPVPSNWYNLQAGSVGAATLYWYNGICTGNSFGNCLGAGGVVLHPAWSIGIWWPTESNGWGLSVHKDDWAMVTRKADGGDNAEPTNSRGSIYANDMYLRSTGKWVSQVGAVTTTTVTSDAQDCSSWINCTASVNCPAGYKVSGGGHIFLGDFACAEVHRFTVNSYPIGDYWWTVTMACSYARVYAVCIK